MAENKQKHPGGRPLKNNKYEEFCQQYIIDNNAAQAAIRAGYSEKGANSKGSQLLAIISIQERISFLRAELQEKTGISAERVIQEFARVALVDPAQAFDGNGNLLSISDMPADLRRGIASIEIKTQTYGKGDNETEETTHKIRFWDKNKALENLGKHLGVYSEDNKQKAESLAQFLKGLE